MANILRIVDGSFRACVSSAPLSMVTERKPLRASVYKGFIILVGAHATGNEIYRDIPGKLVDISVRPCGSESDKTASIFAIGGGKNVVTKMTNASGGVNLQNRDPNTISNYLQVEFDDVIAEPEGTYTIDCIWKNSYKVFTGSKNCCYKALTILFAFPIALIIGLSFAILSFQHIWCVGPAIRHCRINGYVVKQYMRTILDSFCAPCCSTMALCFSRVRIQMGSGSSGSKDGDGLEEVV